MLRRVALASFVVALVAACGGDSDESERSLPDVTLFTTTTTSTTTTTIAPTTTDEPAATTTVATTTTSTTTTVAPTTTIDDPASQFELLPDGLGPASFGADPDGIIGFVSSFLGPPTRDTGYVDPFEFGVCSGTQARRVYWGSLMLEFGDASDVAADRLHFYAYEYGTTDPAGIEPGTPEGLATPEGITLGSTVGEVSGVYPTAQFLQGNDVLPPIVVVNDNFRGLLTGLSGVDTVTVLVGGLPCEG